MTSVPSQDWIELSPLLRIPVSSPKVHNDVCSILEELYLAPFLQTGQPISPYFISILSGPMSFQGPIDTSGQIHPLIYFIAGLTGDSLQETANRLSVFAPIDLIQATINSANIPLHISTQDMQARDKLLSLYAPITQLGGSNLLLKLYTLTAGDETYMVTTLIICILYSMSITLNPIQKYSYNLTAAVNSQQNYNPTMNPTIPVPTTSVAPLQTDFTVPPIMHTQGGIWSTDPMTMNRISGSVSISFLDNEEERQLLKDITKVTPEDFPEVTLQGYQERSPQVPSVIPSPTLQTPQMEEVKQTIGRMISPTPLASLSSPTSRSPEQLFEDDKVEYPIVTVASHSTEEAVEEITETTEKPSSLENVVSLPNEIILPELPVSQPLYQIQKTKETTYQSLKSLPPHHYNNRSSFSNFPGLYSTDGHSLSQYSIAGNPSISGRLSSNSQSKDIWSGSTSSSRNKSTLQDSTNFFSLDSVNEQLIDKLPVEPETNLPIGNGSLSGESVEDSTKTDSIKELVDSKQENVKRTKKEESKIVREPITARVCTRKYEIPESTEDQVLYDRIKKSFQNVLDGKPQTPEKTIDEIIDQINDNLSQYVGTNGLSESSFSNRPRSSKTSSRKSATLRRESSDSGLDLQSIEKDVIHNLESPIVITEPLIGITESTVSKEANEPPISIEDKSVSEKKKDVIKEEPLTLQKEDKNLIHASAPTGESADSRTSVIEVPIIHTKPETVEEPVEGPTPIKEEPMEVPTSIKEGPVEVPTPIKEEPVEVPTPIKEGPVEVPTPIKEGPVEVPTPIKEGPVEVPTPIMEEPMEVPTPIKKEPMEVPTPIKEEPMEVPTPIMEEPMEVPTPIKEEPMEVPTPIKEEPMEVPTSTKEVPVELAKEVPIDKGELVVTSTTTSKSKQQKPIKAKSPILKNETTGLDASSTKIAESESDSSIKAKVNTSTEFSIQNISSSAGDQTPTPADKLQVKQILKNPLRDSKLPSDNRAQEIGYKPSSNSMNKKSQICTNVKVPDKKQFDSTSGKRSTVSKLNTRSKSNKLEKGNGKKTKTIPETKYGSTRKSEPSKTLAQDKTTKSKPAIEKSKETLREKSLYSYNEEAACRSVEPDTFEDENIPLKKTGKPSKTNPQKTVASVNGENGKSASINNKKSSENLKANKKDQICVTMVGDRSKKVAIPMQVYPEMHSSLKSIRSSILGCLEKVSKTYFELPYEFKSEYQSKSDNEVTEESPSGCSSDSTGQEDADDDSDRNGNEKHKNVDEIIEDQEVDIHPAAYDDEDEDEVEDEYVIENPINVVTSLLNVEQKDSESNIVPEESELNSNKNKNKNKKKKKKSNKKTKSKAISDLVGQYAQLVLDMERDFDKYHELDEKKMLEPYGPRNGDIQEVIEFFNVLTQEEEGKFEQPFINSAMVLDNENIKIEVVEAAESKTKKTPEDMQNNPTDPKTKVSNIVDLFEQYRVPPGSSLINEKISQVHEDIINNTEFVIKGRKMMREVAELEQDRAKHFKPTEQEKQPTPVFNPSDRATPRSISNDAREDVEETTYNPTEEILKTATESKEAPIKDELHRDEAVNQEIDPLNVRGKVKSIQECFPDMDVKLIERHIHASNYDLNMAFESILLDDGSISEPKFEGLPEEKVETADDFTNIKSVMNLTGVLEGVAYDYLQRNDNNIWSAACEIVMNCNLEKQPAKTKKPTTKPVTLTSRVQYGGGPAKKNAFSVLATTESEDDSDETASSTYVYNENSPEAQELKEIYLGNEEFREMSEVFFRKALVLFKGDCTRAITLAMEFVTAGESDLSFNYYTEAATSNDKVIDYSVLGKKSRKPQSALLGSKITLGHTPKKVTSSSANQPKKTSTVMHGSVTSSKKGVLDLHNYLVPEATALVRQALDEWWGQEQEKRILDGRFDKFGSDASFVDPLTIVTGRGIHSQGGVAKIRPSVYKILIQNGYIFEESASLYVVTGKKSKK
ncbi:hypothetical protein CAAN1_02S07602 [[Candida] anglica]